ncbi:hypothetical protein ACFSVJ_27435 [Prauserella oleivorans]
MTGPLTTRRATGMLRTFEDAGVLEPADVHVAYRLGALGGETREPVLLAVALGVRALRLGSVCLELDRLPALASGAEGRRCRGRTRTPCGPPCAAARS